MKTSHPIAKNTFIHSYTYTFFHGQRLSFVKVGEDQSNGCQSLTLENTNRSSGVHSYLLRSQQCEDVCSQMCVCYSPVPCHLPVFPHELSLVFLWQRNKWGCYSTARLSSPRRVAAKICFLEHTSRTAPASGEAWEEYPQPAEKRASC